LQAGEELLLGDRELHACLIYVSFERKIILIKVCE
jgi:hypothetical protein